MNRLLLTIPYCTKDSTLALHLLRWMQELQPSGYKPHSCLIAADAEVPSSTRREIFTLARPMFAHAFAIVVPVPPDHQGWMLGSNYMFEKVSDTINQNTKLPWLWCEPDCVPLREGWLDALASAYADCPTRFMGFQVHQSNQPGMPPIHLSGCAIYDAQAHVGMKDFTQVGGAFDIAAANYTTPRSLHSPLFQYFWGKPDLAPTFKEIKADADPENTIPMGWLNPKAVIFHRSKDGSLVDCLRQRRVAKNMPPKSSAPKSKPAPAQQPALVAA